MSSLQLGRFRFLNFIFFGGKMTSTIWRENLFLELRHGWSYNENPCARSISNLKTFLKYLIAVKSCGELNFKLGAIFSNKMAGNSNFRSPQLLIQLRYFKCFFSLVILVLFAFNKFDQLCHSSKNRLSRQIDDVILPPKNMKFRNPNRPSCKEERVLSYCKV